MTRPCEQRGEQKEEITAIHTVSSRMARGHEARSYWSYGLVRVGILGILSCSWSRALLFADALGGENKLRLGYMHHDNHL